MPTAAPNLLPRYQFGDLTLDLGQRRLKRGEESLDLGKLTFDFLRVLVESSPNVVTHDELAEKVWGGLSVSPETITQRAMMLRQALSDDADRPKYFEVLRSQGYRLIPEVSRLEALERQDRRRWGLALAAGLVTVFVALVSVYSFLEGESDVLPYSVAVLPFENLSTDPDNAFFCGWYPRSDPEPVGKDQSDQRDRSHLHAALCQHGKVFRRDRGGAECSDGHGRQRAIR